MNIAKQSSCVVHHFNALQPTHVHACSVHDKWTSGGGSLCWPHGKVGTTIYMTTWLRSILIMCACKCALRLTPEWADNLRHCSYSKRNTNDYALKEWKYIGLDYYRSLRTCSLVPRPSATSFLSHTWPLNPCQISGRRPGTTPTSFTSKVDTVTKQLDYTYVCSSSL